MSASARSPVVYCPTCGQPVTWIASHAHRPFCSERCKLIDLGEWASERRAIPGESAGFVLEDSSMPPE